MHNANFALIDVNYTAKALLYTEAGALTNGVLFGLMRSILNWKKRFPFAQSVFCFDARKNFRRDISRSYKSQRNKDLKLSPDEAETLSPKDQAKRRLNADLYRQVDEFRQVLIKLGLNQCHEEGYEADDHIALYASYLTGQDQTVVICSTDKDYYQCLNDNCVLFNPMKKVYFTYDDFCNGFCLGKEFKGQAADWATVLAIAGCSTDEILGVKGVGPASAAKFLMGTLSSVAMRIRILQAWDDLVAPNLRLTKLPFDPPPVMKYTFNIPPILTGEAWDAACAEYNMPSLIGQIK